MPWITSDDMHLRALENLTNSYPLLTTIDRMSLVKSTWHHLKAFAGAPEAIKRLRTKYTVVVLTILNWESIVSSSKEAKVEWDGILSCEFLGYYKPSLQSYLKGISLLGLKPAETMMVAAHKGDLAAAQFAGMHTAYVNVPEEDNVAEGFEQPIETKFDIEASDFEALCVKLGYHISPNLGLGHKYHRYRSTTKIVYSQDIPLNPFLIQLQHNPYALIDTL